MAGCGHGSFVLEQAGNGWARIESSGEDVVRRGIMRGSTHTLDSGNGIDLEDVLHGDCGGGAPTAKVTGWACARSIRIELFRLFGRLVREYEWSSYLTVPSGVRRERQTRRREERGGVEVIKSVGMVADAGQAPATAAASDLNVMLAARSNAASSSRAAESSAEGWVSFQWSMHRRN